MKKGVEDETPLGSREEIGWKEKRKREGGVKGGRKERWEGGHREQGREVKRR